MKDTCCVVIKTLISQLFAQITSTEQYVLYKHTDCHTISNILHTVIGYHSMTPINRIKVKLSHENSTISLWRTPHWLQYFQGQKCGTGPQSKIFIPRQVALGFPGRLRPRIFSTFDTTRVVGRQPNSPATVTPGEIPGTHFQRLNRPQGTWFCRKEPRNKSQVTPPVIDSGTVRLVVQRVNHYATPGPSHK
jgi:hypothetical protein